MREGGFYPDHGLDRIVAYHERQDARFAEAAAELSERTGKPILVATRAGGRRSGQPRPGGRARVRSAVLPERRTGRRRARSPAPLRRVPGAATVVSRRRCPAIDPIAVIVLRGGDPRVRAVVGVELGRRQVGGGRRRAADVDHDRAAAGAAPGAQHPARLAAAGVARPRARPEPRAVPSRRPTVARCRQRALVCGAVRRRLRRRIGQSRRRRAPGQHREARRRRRRPRGAWARRSRSRPGSSDPHPSAES